jgi:hypothetical protein
MMASWIHCYWGCVRRNEVLSAAGCREAMIETVACLSRLAPASSAASLS